MQQLTYDDIKAATDRTAGHIRPVTVTPVAPVAPVAPETIRTARRGPLDAPSEEPYEVWFALEFMQYTGSFKARGAQNFIQAHREAGTLPSAGVTIASGGNAGLACAWAAQQQGVRATVFVPIVAPAVKVARLRGFGADVRVVGAEYAEALEACEEFAVSSGALAAHAYDHPLIAAGAGTLLEEIHAQIPGLDTVVVSVGGGGLFAGVATAARHHKIRTVAVEPENCRALNAAIEAGRPVDVPVDSVAVDALGARRATALALHAADRDDVRSVLVPDGEIVRARKALWDHRRVAVEHAAATALAALSAPDLPNGPNGPNGPTAPGYGYRPRDGERVAVVLCGANTDPSDLVHPADH
ncbi:serine/threonine dehydratase [Streptomyces sp. NBC_01618]|uniref:serine/threonine dehydratase n=1 Tax=Streptomyces sp. NBC_01618 TaxID=2975900 RepID=UPI0038648AC1|nr:serine/threonine dehydratase [Streptomyces sp. NBC_01618]